MSMVSIGLGQAPTVSTVNRIRVITGVPGAPSGPPNDRMILGSGAIYYPSQNPEDYGPDWKPWPFDTSPATLVAQEEARRWLATEYPEEVVEGVEQGMDTAGNPVYRIQVRDRAVPPLPVAKECPKDTIIPCVPDWMLWVGVGLLVLVRR